MIRIEVEQKSEAWFQNKPGRISGTKFKPLMMSLKTKGYRDMVSEIAGEIITGEIEETPSTYDMERGNNLEPFSRELYEEIFEVKVEQTGFIIPNEDNEFHEWIGISPDGGIDNFTGLLEIKNLKRKNHLHCIKFNEIPEEYIPQVQGQLFTTKAKYCDFMSTYPNMKPFIKRVYPNPEYHKAIEERLRLTIKLIKEEIENYNNYDYLD